MPLPHELLVLFVASLAAPTPSAAPLESTSLDREGVELIISAAQDLAIVDSHSKVPQEVEETKPASQSVGLTNSGSLRNGKRVAATETLRFKHGTPEHERFATDELAQLLHAAAVHVSKVHPGAALTLGDLAREDGGAMSPHVSHTSGRDADVLFYALELDGSVAQPDRFVAWRRNGIGRAPGRVRYRFDDARNWELVSYLLENDIAEVEWMFISYSLERRLLAEGRRQGADPELLARAGRVLKQSGGHHDDHFHMRVLCDDGDRPLCRNR